MAAEVQQSLIARTGMALAAVILMALVTMVASYLTAESTENDAVRINLAGSLRMQSYRIAEAFLLVQQKAGEKDLARLRESVQEFENRLDQAVLATYIKTSGNEELKQSFTAVTSQWHMLRPRLLDPSSPQLALLREVDDFVTRIDSMVYKLERQTESKYRVLRLIQGVSLLLNLGLAGIMFFQVYRYVVGPLQELVTMAGRVRAGDFSMRLEGRGDDELSLLADTFNAMSESLEEMYRNLEEKVQSKTRHLEETQEALRFLYDCSQRLSTEGNLVGKLELTASHLQRQLGAVRVEILLARGSPAQPFVISTGDTLPSPAAGIAARSDGEEYPLRHESKSYGTLRVCPGKGRELGSDQSLLVTSVAEMVAATVANEARKDQARRVAVMEERTAIARELHDSLAQSLSFTRIQISRFQALREKGAPDSEIDDVLGEIRTGIQAANGQLRELLTTFRLQLAAPGLQASLADTVREFSERGGLPVALEGDLANYPLTPNEEIHVLQIVREALSNVLRHSGATSARIRLSPPDREGRIEVSISDDGCGLSHEATGHDHYGKTIMGERAAVLGGCLEFGDAREGGTEVKLRFRPAVADPTDCCSDDLTTKVANR